MRSTNLKTSWKTDKIRGTAAFSRVGYAIPAQAEIPLNCFVKTVSHHTPHGRGSNLDQERTGVGTQRIITPL